MGLEHSPCKWPGWAINAWSELTSYVLAERVVMVCALGAGESGIQHLRAEAGPMRQAKGPGRDLPRGLSPHDLVGSWAASGRRA